MSSHDDSFVRSGNSPTPDTAFDFSVENHGSIFLLHLHSDAAREWVEDYIGSDNGYQPYWPTVVVEHRYMADIVRGIQNDGLVVL